MRIWKYEVPIEDSFELELPEGAQVVSVQSQRGIPCMWVHLDPNADCEPRRFAVHGTGHPIPDDGRKFLGTFQTDDGRLVFHLFEVKS